WALPRRSVTKTRAQAPYSDEKLPIFRQATTPRPYLPPAELLATHPYCEDRPHTSDLPLPQPQKREQPSHLLTSRQESTNPAMTSLALSFRQEQVPRCRRDRCHGSARHSRLFRHPARSTLRGRGPESGPFRRD